MGYNRNTAYTYTFNVWGPEDDTTVLKSAAYFVKTGEEYMLYNWLFLSFITCKTISYYYRLELAL